MDTKSAPRYAFEQFTAIRRYQADLAFSPDGSEVAYSTNISGQFNLWRQSSAGGYPHQLTFYTEQTVRQLKWSPDGRGILYTADRHGDEFHQLYLIPARGGLPEQLTDAPSAQHYLASGSAWSPDGRYVAYAANDRVSNEQDVLIRDMETGEVRRAMTGSPGYSPAYWSPDGRHLTVVDFKTTNDYDIYLLSLEDGSVRNLTPDQPDVAAFAGPWAADGSGFYFLSDLDRDFTGLSFYDLASGESRQVETPDWDIEQVTASPDGRFLAWTVNENGYSRLHVRDLDSGSLADLPAIPDGVIRALRFSRAGHKIGLQLARADHPTEVYVLDIEAGTLAQLTYSMLGGIPEEDLVSPELVHYPTHDSREIPAYLYRPRGEGRLPVVLSIHGGPESQERPDYLYSGMYQYLLNRGIGVLAPNIRGSTGYGKAYRRLLQRDWGGAELKDLEAAVFYLRSLDWVDPERIGVFGGSFGGFATLSCVSRLPDYWAVAVDIVGPSNLVTFLKAVPPTWQRFTRDWLGDPEADAEFLMSRSPISYVERIKTPLFIIQGAKDPRVVKAESDQMAARLRERGVDVRYDVYEDEGHGFTKRENELKAFRDSAEFLERHLLG